ncbi:MAG: RNB domain-containing ribonuclease [Deferribacteres bacterium]|nr:RNB domain-containing ribonuclease [candidate division KSB1 bacterium]MCB9500401.1 RNB domain-containing ribonuclease [Deferribacteres bacterium]
MKKQGSLVLYKNRPARVLSLGEKLEIVGQDGKTRKVRGKDVELLHPGPFENFSELKNPEGDVKTAWELLAGEKSKLSELAELIYDAYTPATAWATWELVDDGLYFSGIPQEILVHTVEEVEAEKNKRQEKVDKKNAWGEFIERLRNRQLIEEDFSKMGEIEAVAYGKSQTSKIMTEIGMQITREKAHELLLKTNVWNIQHNSWPRFFDLHEEPQRHPVPALPDEERLDLTHLPAFAIDDEGATDPDDALSIDGETLWVHIADAGALIAPDSELDLEARGIGANLYLPEKVTTMLPQEVTLRLGLGLQEISPALSFGLKIDEAGEITDLQIKPSLVKVSRLTYAQANNRLLEEPLASMWQVAQRFQKRRLAAGAVNIDLPEVKIRVKDNEVEIRPIEEVPSRQLVMEAMVMTGEAAARFADENVIQIPFITQPPSDEILPTSTWAEKFVCLRSMKRSEIRTSPGPHFGLGLQAYTRVTSPLRRYTDLVVHQQLRAFLLGKEQQTYEQALERMAMADTVSGNVRQCERQSNRHWTMVYLHNHPDWREKAIVVDQRGHRGRILIPSLGADAEVHLEKTYELNTEIEIEVSKLRFAELEMFFKVVG